MKNLKPGFSMKINIKARLFKIKTSKIMGTVCGPFKQSLGPVGRRSPSSAIMVPTADMSEKHNSEGHPCKVRGPGHV